ncbi:MAG: 3-methyladenine DNA glycosylase [Lacisediminihabitans sp.]
MTVTTGIRLAAAEWRERELAHQERADSLTSGWRSRAQAGVGGGRLAHPVDDFLFTYYPYRPALLRRWHPGAGVALADAENEPRADWNWYLTEAATVRVNSDGFRAAKADRIRPIMMLLRGTLGRAANFGCLGLHEWAMVYRAPEARHEVPLRLGATGTDAVVESHNIGCSHFDAFRFFTPEAVSRNRLSPSRENQPVMEQPGCLHAGMDLYKWSAKLGPLVPGELLLDTFELARDIRELDMQASPYDLAEWGYEPVRIETTEGKTEYVRRQRVFTERANTLRVRLLDVVKGNAVRPTLVD